MISFGFSNTVIEIPQWGSATLIEILWLASGLMALSFSSLRIHALWVDYQLTMRLGHADLCIIARGYLRREVLRIVTALAITFIGVYSVLTDPLLPGPARISISGLLITASLFVISLIVSVNSVLDWHDRIRTMEIVRRSER
jgi:hypothetical protein